MLPERMVKAIMVLYVETKTRVKTMAGVSKDFDIGVGVAHPVCTKDLY